MNSQNHFCTFCIMKCNSMFSCFIILTFYFFQVEIEEIHFSHGLLVQKADLFSVIIEKYGIILLATCLITVGMILLLICVVIYYRRKTRHSAHCLTDVSIIKCSKLKKIQFLLKKCAF